MTLTCLLLGPDFLGHGGKFGSEGLVVKGRELRGVKFKDADLLGIPVRITVGRGAADGMIEYKMRRDADKEEMSAAEGIKKAIDVINAEK